MKSDSSTLPLREILRFGLSPNRGALLRSPLLLSHQEAGGNAVEVSGTGFPLHHSDRDGLAGWSHTPSIAQLTFPAPTAASAPPSLTNPPWSPWKYPIDSRHIISGEWVVRVWRGVSDV